MPTFDVEITVKLAARVEDVWSAREAMDIVISNCYGVPQERITDRTVDVVDEQATQPQ
jgi:hypothetical protein